ncbi:MAG: hypothetical protein ACD_48C00225G0001, partial [uncultured bacterium]
KYYFGLDYDLEALKDGVASSDEMSYGIWADISRLETIPDVSIGVVVSTFTVYHLDNEKQKMALDHLCRITRIDGILLCELPIKNASKQSLDVFQKYFNNVEYIYFKNPFSRLYESFIIDKNGKLRSWAQTFPFRILAWILSFAELVTFKNKDINSHVLIVADKKKGFGCNNDFDFKTFPLIANKIVDLMNNV